MYEATVGQRPASYARRRVSPWHRREEAREVADRTGNLLSGLGLLRWGVPFTPTSHEIKVSEANLRALPGCYAEEDLT